jgi:hypothetical protein
MTIQMRETFHNGATEKAARDAFKKLTTEEQTEFFKAKEELAKLKAEIAGDPNQQEQNEIARLRAELAVERKRNTAQGSDPLSAVRAARGEDIKKASDDYFGAILGKDKEMAKALLFTAVWMSRSQATSACYRGRTLDRLVWQMKLRVKRLEQLDAEGSPAMDLVSDLTGLASQEADGPEVTVQQLRTARSRLSDLELDRVTVMAVLLNARAFHDRFGADMWESPERGQRDGVARPGDMFGFGK